jgi:outer membrane protein OmpA-like peptidoglycan-associated protein
MKRLGLWLAVIPFLAAHLSVAQIEIDTTFSAGFLVNEILIGKGILVGNVTYKGTKHSIGLFNDDSKQVGLEQGLILSSGNVFYSAGPNKNPRTGWASNTMGDDDLDRITRGRTYDAAVLEFDFVTVSENLVFNFVFASEEYQEYVGSKFNDVFGFFLTGPNADHVNLATLPDGKTPITINSVNHETGQEYYVDNPYHNNTDPYIWDVRKQKVVKNKRFRKQVEPPRYNIQFDGFTTVLEARYLVIPNEIYHIKMAIADVSDGILDSGVFLEAGSFTSFGDEIVVISKSFDLPVEKDPGPLLAADKIMTTELRNNEDEELNEERENEDLELEDVILNVQFDFDSYQIREVENQVISNVIHILQENPELEVVVQGHTDSWGSDDYNLILSKNRSNSVVHKLKSSGIAKTRIKQEFLGESLPISTNETSEGRAINRRVEFLIWKSSEK